MYKGFFKLQEEMGELNQILGKLGAFPEGPYPDGTNLSIALEEELADLLATIIYFYKNNPEVKLDTTRIKDKLTKFENWKLSEIQ